MFMQTLVTERAVEIIENHDPDTPLFLYMAHSSVHTPIQAPEKYKQLYADSGLSEHRQVYLAMVSGVDDTLKQVVKASDFNVAISTCPLLLMLLYYIRL